MKWVSCQRLLDTNDSIIYIDIVLLGDYNQCIETIISGKEVSKHNMVCPIKNSRDRPFYDTKI